MACCTAIGLSTGKVDDKGALRLRIKADPAIYPVAIESDGDVTIERGAAKYAGTMHIAARDDTPAGAAGEQAASGAGQGQAAGMARARQLRARSCQARPR